jgi:GNAT superfamily N-acetyltransferase
MSSSDLQLGMRLKQQAGWNQTEADWRRFLDMEPAGCFVAEWQGTAVGTVTTCMFPPVGWIAMVLVDEPARSRGIGTALVAHALEYLRSQGSASIRLDATVLGRPVYEKLAFAVEYPVIRFAGRIEAQRAHGRPAEAVSPQTWPELVRFDRAMTGNDRSKMLLRLFAEQPTMLRLVRENGGVAGYLTARPGSEALQVGPCLARDEAGALLLADAGARFTGRRVVIDIPAGNQHAAAQAERLGLAPSRDLVRMRWGKPVQESLANIWAGAGLEKG